MSDLNPYDIRNLSGAAVRPILFPTDTPGTMIPTNGDDLFAQTAADDYAPVTPGWDVGATAGPAQVGRNMTTSGYNIEQAQTPLLEEPDVLTYTVQIPMAELHAQTIQVMNQGKISAASASAAGVTSLQKVSAADIVKFGNVDDLDHYSVALVVRRKKAQGVVREGTPTTSNKRGRFLTFFGYDCTIQAENVQTNFGKGQLAQMAVTFKLYPIADQPDGEEYGMWIDERAGIIAT